MSPCKRYHHGKSPSADLFELPWGRFIDRLSCYRIIDAQDRLCFCVFIRGKHPVCGEPLFCFSANPDSLSLLCGFHIDHRSRSFLLQVSGISSLLSFCCTSLVSGLIIQEDARFVYWQTAQRMDFVFVQCWNLRRCGKNCPEVPGRLWRIFHKRGESARKVLCAGSICAKIAPMNGSRRRLARWKFRGTAFLRRKFT